MERVRILLVLPLLCSLGIISQCDGAPVVQLDASNRATGITGLDIGGTEYNALFRVGPATEIWPDGIATATFLGDQAGAEAAVNAMVEALNWLPIPSELADPGGAVKNFIMVPFSFSATPTYIAGLTAIYSSDKWLNLGFSFSRSSNDTTVPWAWAVFSPSELQGGTVPAPSALVLTMTGMMSLLGVGRLRRRHWGPQSDSI